MYGTIVFLLWSVDVLVHQNIIRYKKNESTLPYGLCFQTIGGRFSNANVEMMMMQTRRSRTQPLIH